MSEAILKALMQLFALVVDIDEVQQISDRERAIIRSFLARQLNNELVDRYMTVFDEYLHLYHKDAIDRGSLRDRKRTSLTAVRILGICEKINEELEQTQKFYVLIQLIGYIAYGIEIREKELDFLQTVASAFHISEEEYQDILGFVAFSLEDIPGKEKVLLISSEENNSAPEVYHIRKEYLAGEIFFLHILSVNMYVMKYHGKEDLLLNGQLIQHGLTYTFEHGSSIRGTRIEPIYYTDVSGIFSASSTASRISLVVRQAEYRFPNSNHGIHQFNFREESGKLVGIMGGSGVGKSTLLNVLNGNLPPRSGEVLINGYNLYDPREREDLDGVIGFIPQEDLLMEELTVWQNLYYNARLCLADQEEAEIHRIVDQVLTDLDLSRIRDLKVGKPLHKIISGGQRKRVNIGLELLREPSILYVDEPTSGLSSVDSEMVMNLLREQVHKGKLVIVNIHQPSSDLYKMFDRIIFLDQGGYQIYYGNPSEAVIYFKTQSNLANAREDQCACCGNVDPDQVLQIIEAKVVNEHGKLSRTRKVSPGEWFRKYKTEVERGDPPRPAKSRLPDNYYSIPGLFSQLRIFFTRDMRSRLSNHQYVLISLLEAPLLAMILGFFTKYYSGRPGNPGAYLFSENVNLPAYQLMSVIVFLFLGLTISSEEIIKDRKILQRESFLNLSRFSYLNSKVLIMFLISAIQTISYVLIGNLIFEIRGMTFSYFAVLFSTACFANLLGLNISSGLNSVITIYILVPFLLIPQILFSGVLVKYDKLHKSLTHAEYVPVIGDVMTSRWAFEALTVQQFSHNRYHREFFAIDQKISNAEYLEAFLVPTLQGKLKDALEIVQAGNIPDRSAGLFGELKDQLAEARKHHPGLDEALPSPALLPWSDTALAISTHRAMEAYRAELRAHIREYKLQRSAIQDSLIRVLGGLKAFSRFRQRHDNKRLSDMVLNREQIDKIVEKRGRLIRRYEPIYMAPTSRIGRAHLYAPVKFLGHMRTRTLRFNLAVIWLFTGMLYLTLYYDLLRKILVRADNIRIRKPR